MFFGYLTFGCNSSAVEPPSSTGEAGSKRRVQSRLSNDLDPSLDLGALTAEQRALLARTFSAPEETLGITAVCCNVAGLTEHENSLEECKNRAALCTTNINEGETERFSGIASNFTSSWINSIGNVCSGTIKDFMDCAVAAIRLDEMSQQDSIYCGANFDSMLGLSELIDVSAITRHKDLAECAALHAANLNCRSWQDEYFYIEPSLPDGGVLVDAGLP